MVARSGNGASRCLRHPLRPKGHYSDLPYRAMAQAVVCATPSALKGTIVLYAEDICPKTGNGASRCLRHPLRPKGHYSYTIIPLTGKKIDCTLAGGCTP